ncbi:MAG TPA: hypothetical protein P5052_01130 [Candidatus Paceibacterota bacterium]|nr:hypothetical protein [Candidatus Paceibacterota bacterium]HRZ29381.1 hypothetical protein [Candidatus Paceibacterota bacterium]
MLSSDIVGRSNTTDFVAVFGPEKLTIIVYNPCKNPDEQTIIPINQENLNNWKTTHILACEYDITISDKKIASIELLLNEGIQIAETSAAQKLEVKPPQTPEPEIKLVPKKRGRPRKKQLEKPLVKSQDTNPTPKKERIIKSTAQQEKSEYNAINPEIDIRIRRNKEIVIIEIKHTPMSPETFHNLIKDAEQHLNNQQPIQRSTYIIENNTITFQNGKEMEIDCEKLKLIIEFCKQHRIKMT